MSRLVPSTNQVIGKTLYDGSSLRSLNGGKVDSNEDCLLRLDQNNAISLNERTGQILPKNARSRRRTPFLPYMLRGLA